MRRYRTHIIGIASRSLQHLAGNIDHELQSIQTQLGDGWELVSICEGNRPGMYITTWRTV